MSSLLRFLKEATENLCIYMEIKVGNLGIPFFLLSFFVFLELLDWFFGLLIRRILASSWELFDFLASLGVFYLLFILPEMLDGGLI
jgi:hypothetical protein